jgi:hypothetical protein
MTATIDSAGASVTDPAHDHRIRRLNDASIARFTDIDQLLAGRLGDGQLIADELLSVEGLGLDLTPEQRHRLAREEVASLLAAGVEFECVLMAGFALQIVDRGRPTDPRTVYALHEVGEETRHSRVFIDLIDQIRPTSVNPLNHGIIGWIGRRGIRIIIGLPALMYTLVLGGEEIPDLIQKVVSEHPDSDPHLRAVNRYHRAEEARHLSFARTVLPEVWADAGPIQRWAVRHLGAGIVGGMWDTLLHPGLYSSIGLPGWKTWRAVRRTPRRVALRHQATRPVLKSLLDAGIISRRRVPRSWRELCGVDRAGTPMVERA